MKCQERQGHLPCLVGELLTGLELDISVRDVLIYDKYKKRNEHPFPVRRHYSVKNPFLIYNINLFVNKMNYKKWKDESCIGGHSTV